MKTGSKNVMMHVEAHEFLKELPLFDTLSRELSLSKKILYLKKLWNKYGVLADISAFFQDGKDYLEVVLNPTMGNVIFKVSLFAQRALNVQDIEQRNDIIDRLSDDVDKWCREMGLLRHEEEGREGIQVLYHRKRPEQKTLEEVSQGDSVKTGVSGQGDSDEKDKKPSSKKPPSEED